MEMTVCLGLGISPGLFLLRLLCNAALDSGNRKCYNVHEKQSAPDVRQGSDKMRILMIEDDPGLVKGLSFAVKKQGYELDTAKTKFEAEKLCHYGIIISNSKNRITMGFLRLFQTQFNQSSL